MKLYPILAMLFAHLFTGDKVFSSFAELAKDIEKGDFSNMDLMHHVTSGGKSVYT